MRALIIAVVLLMLAAPAGVLAGDEDSQDPKAYTQEDSHPLKLVAMLLSPIGFALEWTVARPLHYLATDSALAPVFGEDAEDKMSTAPPLAEIPPKYNYAAESSRLNEPTAREATITPPAAVSSAPAASTHQPAAAPASVPSPLVSQPVLH